MSKVIDLLQRFNRKERFLLLNHVLGEAAGEVFRLNSDFNESLRDILGLDGIPSDAFVAMDYHLDWIQMAVYLADGNSQSRCIVYNDDLVKANQEDVDLLVAFEDGSTKKVHLVLIEAKADTGWTNKQLQSKAKRLKQIFNEKALRYVTPHFVLMSPGGGARITTDEWPHWMGGASGSALWLKLPFPDGRLKVTRCDEDRKNSASGGWISCSKRQGGRWTKDKFP